MARRLLVPSMLVAAMAETSGNMNGKYMVASGSQADPLKGVHFNDDYASKGYEYFDVWAPEIATHYGEVFWTDQGDLPIPDAIAQRFKGKVMAIMGYEQDQVMVQPVGHPGENPKDDVSVPINWVYNHHYMAFMTGTQSEMHMQATDPGIAHGATSMKMPRDLPSASLRDDTSIPTKQMFSEGNGGESRKSFHGYPKGYAQLIDSPTTWHITPMQIDTRNRDCGVTPADVKNCTKMVPGIEPKQARYGRGIPKDTNYSGILECPCNSRYGGDPMFYPNASSKIVKHEFFVVDTGSCAAEENIVNAADCFAAAPNLGIKATHFINKTISNATAPKGCSVVPEKDGSATAYFNSEGNGKCSGSQRVAGSSTTSNIGVSLSLDLDGSSCFNRDVKGFYCLNNRNALLKKFISAGREPDQGNAALEECQNWCWGNDQCWGCSVDCDSDFLGYGILGSGCQFNAISSCGAQVNWAGWIAGDISEKQQGGGSATITATGPAGAWFGVGFNATAMSDAPYTLVMTASGVIERKIGTCGSEAEHCPGDQLASSVTVVSNSVSGGVRTVVMKRPFKGATSKHYSFGIGNGEFNLIMAVGSSQVFAYHKKHTGSSITLTSVGSSSCVCDRLTGQLCENGGTNCHSFVKNCVAGPAGDLLTQHNPTCNSHSYSGGLSCCTHKRILLDQDQEIRPELLRYHMKWRFWFQEYKPAVGTGKASHLDLPRIYFQTEAFAGEYDIPPAFARPGNPVVGYPEWPLNKPTPGTSCTGTCPDGPDCECLHTITFHWNMSNTRLIYAGGHCHAPSCARLDLYRNDSGTPKLLCRQTPIYGQGNVEVDKYDEAGYILIPPCLWSDDPSEGLQPTEWLPENTPMFSIKQERNTHLGHFGQMASWQMRGVSTPPLRREATTFV